MIFARFLCIAVLVAADQISTPENAVPGLIEEGAKPENTAIINEEFDCEEWDDFEVYEEDCYEEEEIYDQVAEEDLPICNEEDGVLAGQQAEAVETREEEAVPRSIRASDGVLRRVMPTIIKEEQYPTARPPTTTVTVTTSASTTPMPLSSSSLSRSMMLYQDGQLLLQELSQFLSELPEAASRDFETLVGAFNRLTRALLPQFSSTMPVSSVPTISPSTPTSTAGSTTTATLSTNRPFTTSTVAATSSRATSASTTATTSSRPTTASTSAATTSRPTSTTESTSTGRSSASTELSTAASTTPRRVSTSVTGSTSSLRASTLSSSGPTRMSTITTRAPTSSSRSGSTTGTTLPGTGSSTIRSTQSRTASTGTSASASASGPQISASVGSSSPTGTNTLITATASTDASGCQGGHSTRVDSSFYSDLWSADQVPTTEFDDILTGVSATEESALENNNSELRDLLKRLTDHLTSLLSINAF